MSPHEYEMLLVEDAPANAELTVRSLCKEGNHAPPPATFITKSAGISK